MAAKLRRVFREEDGAVGGAQRARREARRGQVEVGNAGDREGGRTEVNAGSFRCGKGFRNIGRRGLSSEKKRSIDEC